MKFLAAKAYILNQLDVYLDDSLYYHGKHHTLDVFAVVQRLCKLGDISEYDTLLVSTAALFHDTGFLRSYLNHESYSCNITRETLPLFDYTEGEIETICEMIMATRIPQTPKNTLEKILCDADLDYLGRADFYTVSETLFQELKAHDLVKNVEEWNITQIKFLDSHQYFTENSKNTREPAKLHYLAELKARMMVKK